MSNTKTVFNIDDDGNVKLNDIVTHYLDSKDLIRINRYLTEKLIVELEDVATERTIKQLNENLYNLDEIYEELL